MIKACVICGAEYKIRPGRGARSKCCSRTCLGQYNGTLRRTLTVADFLIASTDTPGCWEWPGIRHRQGYGRTKHNGKTAFVHRRAWEITNGPIPAGINVLHSCDNPPCCRPSHLFLGTTLDNARDAVQKGRQAQGTRSGSSKLNERSVLEIRASSLGARALARQHGLKSHHTITAIRQRRTWRHI